MVATIEAHLRQRELRRDALYQKARQLRRLSQGAMTHLHEGRNIDDELAEVRRSTRALAEELVREGRGDDGLVHDAFQESVEATLLAAVVKESPFPGPDELSVEPEVYLLGLGDVVGEVRRLALNRLNEGDVAGAERYVHLMDRLYRTLMRFDTTRGIVALKPKQDVARALLERTRGEVTMARVLARAHLPPTAPTSEEK
ncbi:MAG: hypothetical protein L3J96_05095 [Thermoplasmata archaeon]|nr:hypothetical protein [Thermoplasmata archaeon]